MWLEPAGPVINHANRVAIGTTFGIPCSNLENQNNKKMTLYLVAETRTCNERTRQVNRVPTSKNEPLDWGGGGGEMCISSFFHPLPVLWKSGFSELGSHSIALPIVLRSHGVVSSAQPWWARESLILEPSLWLEHFDMPHKIPLFTPPRKIVGVKTMISRHRMWNQN